MLGNTYAGDGHRVHPCLHSSGLIPVCFSIFQGPHEKLAPAEAGRLLRCSSSMIPHGGHSVSYHLRTLV